MTADPLGTRFANPPTVADSTNDREVFVGESVRRDPSLNWFETEVWFLSSPLAATTVDARRTTMTAITISFLRINYHLLMRVSRYPTSEVINLASSNIEIRRLPATYAIPRIFSSEILHGSWRMVKQDYREGAGRLDSTAGLLWVVLGLEHLHFLTWGVLIEDHREVVP